MTQMVALSDCATIVGGATPKTGDERFWGGDIPWATPKDLSNLGSHYLDDTPRRITDAGLKSCAAKILPPNSVLFSSRAPIGHVAINTVPMATNQGFKSLVPDPDRLDSKFLFHWLRVNRPRLEAMGTGATFKELSKKRVAAVEIPLPPLAEQRRIAARLDAADALIAKRERAIALLDELATATFHAMFGDPVVNEKGWEVVALKDAVADGTIVTYGIVQAGPEVAGGVPYIRTSDIVDGAISMAKLRHTAPDIAAKFARSRVEAGEIVMSIRATVGTTALVPPELHGANLTQGTARISPSTRAQRDYLLHHLRSEATQNWISRQVKGATFREITLTRLRDCPIPLPPAPLQSEFGSRIEALSRQRNRLADSVEELEALRASLQSQSFEVAP